MTNSDLRAHFYEELFKLMCGKQLGEGSSRAVYEHKSDRSLVFKFQAPNDGFQNVIEWETWQRVKYTELAEWFAPCISISPCGTVLVQKRTRPASVHPDKVPAFFTDLKLQNFGMLLHDPDNEEAGGRFVCHDYGMHLMLEYGMTKRMRKAKWWTL